MLKGIRKIHMSGRDVWPIVEGGKGISVSDGRSSGAFAAADAIGTFSGANPGLIDENGEYVPLVYKGKTRLERNRELIEYSIKAAISQARIAHDISKGRGRIHMNVLWEMGNVEEVLHGVLGATQGMIHGITCGAGMPYRLAEVAQQYGVYYYPIVSSARAFRILWNRSYRKFPRDLLGGVVYEDPWLAGGHNGLSNSEDPKIPQSPFERVAEIRAFMNEVGMSDIAVIMAGGVWHLKEWESWLDNDRIGLVAFQFGTRPLVTEESPISTSWKKKLLSLKTGDVFLNRFSPTGFYSSAVKNEFICELQRRSERQVPFSEECVGDFDTEVTFGARGRKVYVRAADKERVDAWMASGYSTLMKTPDNTAIFVTEEKAREIRADQVACMGCLSHCKFSNWKDHDDYNTGQKPDPRSFCIQKTLQNIAYGGDCERELMFSGHNAYRFGSDEFYSNGNIPTVAELVNRILTGY
ncbi:NAD(P)H-dependent flavin oxidoreductase [Anaplasma phagocytophilum]|uniref:2-nitropropane dioxygenase family oxidoreductase n=2 Tax=Anaplasma phagocytophilum TaxID=948 RepID=S6GBN4_ANAPH|nr:nitronate monooxygenase [Anaplasma phagocytophilum]EOA62929.1 2-nitropropane dioxygenase family oxidoreductase [Anaplasma phagocytophilum str. CRT38]KDB57627.1 2-nitropropane dioxygenase [Anaplasma phagocytophilum str. CRT35]